MMGNRRSTELALFALPFFLTALGLALFAGQSAASQQPAVDPGLNETWKSDKIEPLIDRLEAESREIYREREAIAGVVGPRPGSVVADIGAGSGFMAELFAKLVGEKGKVYAIDINPTMMQHLADKAKADGLSNLKTVVCDEHSVNLPPRSVDLVFVCDTYHHFAYPTDTLKSIHEALRPNGQLILVDLKKESNSPQWILDHVRASEWDFAREITAAGFSLTNQHILPNIQENYILRFRKVEGRPARR